MLRDYVETTLDAEAIGDLLTMAGFELEGIETVEDEPVLDIKVVSNRGDGLSVFGLAREILAKDAGAKPTELYQQAIKRFPMPDDNTPLPAHPSGSRVQIDTPNCTRYAARQFIGVQNLPSPEWLQARLRKAGQRPLGILVDLTNYVMLELGQPLHAFDQKTLRDKRIVVRQAKPGETITTLNGVDHNLTTDHMMICDAEGVVAVAGVMGGAETEVSDATTEVLLESAHFVNTSVRKTRRQLGLSTEASYRFERSVDPNGVVAALNRYAMLLTEAVGKDCLVPGVDDLYPAPPTAKTLYLRMSRCNRLLGMEVATEDAAGYLERLGFEVIRQGDAMEVTVPSWRDDIAREDDLIEEVGRVHGYERIPEALPAGSTPQGGVFGDYALVDGFREAAIRSGFVQILSHSLRDLHPLDEGTAERIGPRNPHSSDMAWLRDSLLPCLADAAQRNGNRNLHLVEVGRVFAKRDGKVSEHNSLALWSTGQLQPAHWQKSDSPNADFYSLKGVILNIFGDSVEFSTPSSEAKRFHPGRSAEVRVAGQSVGMLGQLHPAVCAQLDLTETVVAAEIDLDAVLRLRQSKEFHIKPVSRNPAVRRDIAILISQNRPYAEIEDAIAQACGEILERQWLFDVYAGKGIPEGSHSLAIALQLRKFGENFTDEEANQVRDQAVQALVALGGTPR